jgi:hypothetical protein
MSLLDSLRQSLTFDASGYPSRRPRSPSLNHNVKQRPPTIFTSKFNGKHRFEGISREAAWARVIGAGSRRVKRKNRPKSGFFQGSVDTVPCPEAGTSRRYI